MVNSINKQFTYERISEKRGIDLQLLVLVILISGIGAVTLFSASWYFSIKIDRGPYFFLNRHMMFLGAGVLFAFLLSYINMEFVKKIASVFLLFTLIINIMVFIPGVGRTISGGTRWIEFAGIKFQPSEFIKISLTIYLAKQFDKKRAIMNDFLRTILPAIIVVGISSLIIIMQNDFSTGFFVVILSVVLLFISGIKKRYLIIISSLGLVLGSIVVLIQPYRIKRILSWLDPAKDPLVGGYQVLASLRALTQGGMTGKGIGAGDIKLGPLPQAHSDFVFAVVGEETGLIGVFAIILLFFLLFLKGLSIASKQNCLFKMFVTAGFSSAIFFQAIMNMGVVCGLFPPTGIPLPFFSQGGTSIVVSFIMLGFIFNMSRNRGIEDEN